jgi:hypothetical protein
MIDYIVLATGSFPTFHIIGYATDEEVFQAEVKNYGYGQSYCIPQSKLRQLN